MGKKPKTGVSPIIHPTPPSPKPEPPKEPKKPGTLLGSISIGGKTYELRVGMELEADYGRVTLKNIRYTSKKPTIDVERKNGEKGNFIYPDAFTEGKLRFFDD